MLTAARARGSCPQCTRQVLSLFEAGINRTPRAFPTSGRRTQITQRLQTTSQTRRLFSSTSTTSQHAQPESEAKSSENEPSTKTPEEQATEDVELIVRQARQAFGKTLPKDYLNEEEYQLYERLYGPPIRDTLPEDVGFKEHPKDAASYYEDAMVVEQTEMEPAQSEAPEQNTTELVSELPSEAGQTYVTAVAQNPREYDALMKLQKDFERHNIEVSQEASEDLEEQEPRPVDETRGEIIEEAEEEGEEAGEEADEEADEGEDLEFMRGETSEGRRLGRDARLHDYTKMGRWRTMPSTVTLPKEDLVDPITALLGRTDHSHIKDAAEKAFGGPRLPFSVATPAVNNSAPQRALGLEAGQARMSEIEADTFLATQFPGMYSSTMSILTEVRRRLGPQWIQSLMTKNGGDGPRILDVGAGGAAASAWQEVLNAEWALAKDRGETTGIGPKGKKSVVVGSDRLRDRVSRFLNDTSFLPRLPDYLHSLDQPDKLVDGAETPLPRKQFDVIIASHMLMPLEKDFQRKAFIDNLWQMVSPEGGILIVLEKGMPRGFEAVAHVRSRLLNEFIEAPASDPAVAEDPEAPVPEREPGSIIAPCTNHKPCPMYLTPGLSPGRKDFCHFSQRFTRPTFLQKVLEVNWRNHEDIDFSFVAVQRGSMSEKAAMTEKASAIADRAFQGYEHAEVDGPDVPDARSLPRQILPPLKRTGHVTLDVCTPAGTIERWTVPKSFSKQAYHDARKTKWGDLWALGAKTRVVRNVRLGKGGTIAKDDGGVRAREAKRKAKGKKTAVIELNVNDSGVFSATDVGGNKIDVQERRTKGGKKLKQKHRQQQKKSLLEELDE